MASYYSNDIPLELAIAAHRGTSHTPERRGEQEIASYAAQLETDHRRYSAFTSDETREAFEAAFQRYREGYAKRFRAYLGAKSRCVSTMIAGPSNFNTSRARKSSDTADNRGRELAEYREKALRGLRAITHPTEQPIAKGDADSVERLVAKLEEAERFQAKAKEINGAIRKAVRGNYNPITAMIALGYSLAQATEFLAPDPLGRIGVPDYRLKNNSAEIRRLKARIEEVRRAKSAITTIDDYFDTGIQLTVAPAENRVRLKFPGKPDARTRAQLKTNGFKWAPSVDGGVWQNYASPTAIAYAQGIASNGRHQKEPAMIIDRETIGEMRAEGLDILVHFFEKKPEATTGEALRHYSQEFGKLIGIPGTTIVAQPCMLYTARELVKRKIDVESFNP